MSMFTGALSVRKMRNSEVYKARLTVRREALGDTVRYDFRCGSVQDVNRHALYLMFCDVSNVDGLNLQAELDAAKDRTYSDVFNVLHGMARNVTRREYRGDVMDSIYCIDNLIVTRPSTSPLTQAQCMEYCGKVSAHNRRRSSKQLTFIYHVHGGRVTEAYANGRRAHTMADVYAVHGSI